MVTWFKSLPWYAQVALFLLALVLLYFFVWKPIKAKLSSGNYQAAVNQSQTALNQLAQQGVKPSYGEAQYTSYANSLTSVFDGCTGAKDSDSFWMIVEPVFEAMKNDADVYALIKAYGVRTFDKCGVFTGDFTGDLAASLGEKFSGAEGFIIGAGAGKGMPWINEILKKNSIVFTF